MTGPTSPTLTVGIDVSKSHLDIHIHPQAQARRFDNSCDGVAAMAHWLRGLAPHRVVMESTGGYERPALYGLLQAQLPVALVNPRPVRDYAKALGLLAKTDQIDARVLALFAQQVPTRLTTAPTERQCLLKELVTRRRQLVDQCAAQRQQLLQARWDAVRQSITRTITHMQTEIAALEAHIQQLIDQDPDMTRRYATLTSVRGIGPAVARVLVSELPELGRCDRGQLTSLVGLAPFNDDSGQRQGIRHIRGGRMTVRNALYMAALVASRHHGVIHDHYQHLLSRGKPKKVALVACMRKLLIHLNSLLTHTDTPHHD